MWSVFSQKNCANPESMHAIKFQLTPIRVIFVRSHSMGHFGEIGHGMNVHCITDGGYPAQSHTSWANCPGATNVSLTLTDGLSRFVNENVIYFTGCREKQLNYL